MIYCWIPFKYLLLKTKLKEKQFDKFQYLRINSYQANQDVKNLGYNITSAFRIWTMSVEL